MRTSQDVFFCAFLMLNGFKIIKFDIIDRGKVKCYFEITDEKWKELKLDFNNSNIAKIKQNIEAIKDLAH